MLGVLVRQLSEDIGEDAIAANDEGSYSVRLEPNLHLVLREDLDEGISLFAVIAPLPKIGREPLLQKAMVANLFGRETGGAVIGLDRDVENITFLMFLTKQLSYRDFHDSLESFVNYADAWRTEIMEFTEQSTD